MKKQFRIAIIMGPEHITAVYQTMVLSYGRNNVAHSMRPEDLFGMLKRLRPTTLIIEPELFHQYGINPEDINAYRKEMKYRILALYPTNESLEVRKKMSGLNPDKEYVCPTEYLTMAMEIPEICTNKYIKRKAPLQESTMENIDRILTECGFHCNTKGSVLLKEALYEMYFDPNLHRRGGATKIYRELAKKYGHTPRVVERSILRFLEISWTPQTEELLRKELNIPENRQFVPMNFGRFTETFNTYYTIKYGYPEKLLAYSRKN